ncbi:MAG: glycosyltransferase family 4 protein, partial [Motiliproteus sp.]|nr:glycosyltransferase family 4 protein [Motiliproteus sp.]
FVFESQYSANSFLARIKEIPKSRYVVNYNGVKQSSQRIDAPPYKDPIRLCAFGVLRPVKGHDVLLDALAVLDSRGISVTLDLYGKGESEPSLREQAESLGVTVNFMGEVPDGVSKMPGYNILVQPSRFESFGYVLLEAMSVNLPVVASNVGGMIEVVKHERNGLLFENESVESLADQIERLIHEPELVAKIVKQGARDVVDRFSVNQMVASLQDVYEKLN